MGGIKAQGWSIIKYGCVTSVCRYILLLSRKAISKSTQAKPRCLRLCLGSARTVARRSNILNKPRRNFLHIAVTLSFAHSGHRQERLAGVRGALVLPWKSGRSVSTATAGRRGK